MLALADIVARIRDQAPAVRHVAHGLAAAEAPPAYPAVYVYPLSESADPAPTVGPIRQRVVLRIATEIIVSSARGAGRGEGAVEAAETARAAVIAALTGWQPSWAEEPLQHRQGRLVTLEAGWASWRDEFETVTWRQ